MNIVCISGNLTKEPETVTTKSDYSIIKLSIANNDERRKNQSGGYDSVVSYFDCDFWTKNPQHWIKQMHKGTPVVITGRLKQEKWEQDGQTRYAVKIVVQGFPIIGKGREEDGPQPAQKGAGPEEFDDDIPF